MHKIPKDTKIRLQKFLAHAGVCSRRAAETLISSGRVSIDGQIVTKLGTKVDPDTNDVRVNGTKISIKRSFIYLLLNKPKGILTTVHDPYGRPTVMGLLGKVAGRVYPVGRLDKDSEGLLLFTNDGALAYGLLHPSHKVSKTYRVTVKGMPSKAELDMLREGVEIEGKKTLPCKIKVLTTSSHSSIIEVILKEGRKRQIKMMFNTIDHRVIRLIRIEMGPLKLGELPPGQFRELTESEIKLLKMAVGCLD